METYPVDSDKMSEYELSDEMKDCCDTMCEDCTIREIQNMADYFQQKASTMRREVEKTVTVADFEKMKEKD